MAEAAGPAAAAPGMSEHSEGEAVQASQEAQPRERVAAGDAAPSAVARPRRSPFRHWLLALNAALGAFLGGALAAPICAALGWSSAAAALYAMYHYTCHQWAFRSFFLFGSQPVAVYDQQQLAALGTDPFTYVGNAALGWKMAFCERDLAIYVGLLLVGLLYARPGARFRPLGMGWYVLLILPMAVDGFTQLFGWRESTWQLRVVTGLLFGLASAWLVLPWLDASFGLRRLTNAYDPVAACDQTPLPRQSPRR